jgi:diaminopimelate epimerase
MKEIEFVKAVASGNDFIIVDSFKKLKPEAKNRISKLARQLCQRKVSVGADGLLLIEPSKKANLKMRIFNPNGTEVDMCGNGARCVALYAVKKKISGHKMLIETEAGNLQAEVKKDSIKIKMPTPKDIRLKFDLTINGQRQSVSYINTGVPHVVVFVQKLDDFNVETIGSKIRYHSDFCPQGTNADFVKVLGKGRIMVRTYERGVEQETLACGTGCVAASVITICQMEQKAQRKQYKIKVKTQSGEILTVYCNREKDIFRKIFLEGKAKLVYRGGLYV